MNTQTVDLPLRVSKAPEKGYATGVTTGVYVRAIDHNGKWASVDVATLDEDSLLRWLRSRDGDNMLAENMVGILLGHGQLHPPTPEQPDMFTWNKKGGYNRRAIEAFLREAGAYYERHMSTLHDQRGTGWLLALLDKTPSQMAKD
jgi:hypothetical protein